jgi:hypothetical protein
MEVLAAVAESVANGGAAVEVTSRRDVAARDEAVSR